MSRRFLMHSTLTVLVMAIICYTVLTYQQSIQRTMESTIEGVVDVRDMTSFYSCSDI